MKMKLLLSIVMMFLPIVASQASVEINGIYYDLHSNNRTAEVVKNPSHYSGNIIIPGAISYQGESYNVTSIGDYAFYGCRGLTSVTIPNSVTSIGDGAFVECRGLTSATIPTSVTSIGDYAFGDCRSLTSVTIPISVTSIGYRVFEGCSGLISVTIPNSVTSIGSRAFFGCRGLTSVTIPNSVTSIGGAAFDGCSGLTSVTIPNSVTSIGDYAFSGCSGLTAVSIPSSVTSIGDYAFENCSGLTSVTIPSSVTSIGCLAFSGCRGLTSVEISDLVAWCNIFYGILGNPLTYAHHLFLNGNEVTDLVIPDSVTTIGDYAFSDCNGLTSVTIPNSVTSIGDFAFCGCSGLTAVSIPNSVTSIGDYAFENCSGLTSVTIPNSVTSIGGYAFFKCSGLTSVTIPNSVRTIGKYAFSGCSGLSTVISYIDEPFAVNNVFEGTPDDAILYVPDYALTAYQETKGWNSFKTILPIGNTTSISLEVKGEKEQTLTNGVNIIWYDADGKQIGSGNKLGSVEDSTEVYYSIVLDEVLGKKYREVKMRKVVVKESESLTCQLEKIGEIVLHGTVKYEGMALADAEVKIAQWLNGKYEYTASVKTDEKGEFTLLAYNDSTLLTVSASGYVDKRVELRRLVTAELGTIEMEQAQGVILAMALSYQEAVREGQEPVVQSWYSDTRNMAYTVRNMTKNEDITDFAMQYGDIVLPLGSEPGDSIEVTLRSLNGKFTTASGGGTIGADGTANIAIRLVAYGGVEATISQKSDDQLLVMLYGSDGKLVASTTTSGSRIAFTGIEAGSYILVAMGYNGAVGTIGYLSDFEGFGLAEGSDYVVVGVAICDGIIGSVTLDAVPELDVSKFEYTSLNTSYLPNKSEMTLDGSFVTLTARVDFKTQYANDVENVKLVVEIPEGCEFLPNSVVVSTKALLHTWDGNTLTITLSPEDIDSRIRFCMRPKINGIFTSTAYAEFDCHGEKRQSIGTAVFEATAGSVAVPKVSASKQIVVNGIAVPHAMVDVYDDEQQIGSTTALGDGKWCVEVELYKAYNLSTHEIYAKYHTAGGISATTESQECLYDISQIKANTVTMSFYNAYMKKNISVVFDFETGKTNSTNYSFYTATDFTFVADLTANDTTRVKGVNFYVHTTTKEVRQLKGFFDVNLGRWVAVSRFESNNLPVNLDVEINDESIIIGDRDELIDKQANLLSVYNEEKEVLAQFDAAFEDSSDDEPTVFEQIANMLSSDSYSEEELTVLLDKVSIPDGVTEDELSLTDEEAETLNEQLMKQVEKVLAEYGRDQIYAAIGINQGLRDTSFPVGNYSGSIIRDGIEAVINIEEGIDFDESILLSQGFKDIQTTDGSNMYYLYNDSEIIIIDSKTKKRYTRRFDMASESRALSVLRDTQKLPCEELISEVIEIMGAIAFHRIEQQVEDLKRLIDLIDGIYTSCRSFYEKQWMIHLTNCITIVNEIISMEENLYNWHVKEFIRNRDLYRSDPFNAKYRINMYKHCFAINEMASTIKELKVLEKGIIRVKNWIRTKFNKIPLKPTKLSEGLKVGGKLIGGFGVFIELIGLFEDAKAAYNDFQSWRNLWWLIDQMIPCPKNPQEALNLQTEIHKDALGLTGWYLSALQSEWRAIKIDLASLFVEEIPPAELVMWFVSGIFNIYSEWTKYLAIDGYYLDKQLKYSLAIGNLKCKEDQEQPLPHEDTDDNTIDGHIYSNPPFSPITPIHDPSGFVYEAVPTNRVNGVTATIYEQKQSTTPWDAADFSQVNPQITDETGLYAWDVPQGLWQVRFEKSGYETAQTEWLSVPPPQLEINIPMSHAIAPLVTKAKGTESGITLTFSKYMKPESLTTKGRVMVTCNGKEAKGSVEMVNAEENPYNKKVYASQVKFVPNTAFKTTDEVIITVRKEVMSYADKQMDNDFVRHVVIEPEIKAIKCDSLIAVDYMGTAIMEVAVLPADAAKGKSVFAESTSPLIASVEQAEVKLNDEGKARIVVFGELPGGASIHLSMPEAEVEAYTEVSVVIPEKTVKAPKASKRSGSEITDGYLLSLSCATKGAIIYYTMDGTCPCDEQKRIKYTGPIMLHVGQVTIQAIAVRDGMEDSDVVSFNYIVVADPDNVRTVKVNHRFDAIYDNGQIIVKGAEGATCRIYDYAGRELAKCDKLGVRQQISVPQADIYIISVQTEDGTYSRKILKVE